ncbi:hypothetical protein [Oscillibacter sp. GMB15532]|uniref:hypothetical protein n=1 Tax=Oscillibacter sp. GMB15532 TaxID=3230022 RepID=UPI0034E04EC6
MLNAEINQYLGVFSYPFVSLDFLDQDLLTQFFENERDHACRMELRKKLAAYMRRTCDINTLDEIYLILDKWYLYPGHPSQAGKQKNSPDCGFDLIFKHLLCFSKSLISQRDGKIIYKYWENERDKEILSGFSGSNKIYLFHSMQRMFSMDILIALYLVRNKKAAADLSGNYGQIHVSDQLLDSVLEKGVAENHLHSGVAASFQRVWEDFMLPITEAKLKALLQTEPLPDLFYNKKEWIYYLCLAGMLRYFCLWLTANGQEAKKGVPEEFGKVWRILQQHKVKENFAALTGSDDQGSLEQWVLSFWQEVLPSCGSIPKVRQEGIMHTMFAGYASIQTSDENLFLYHVLSTIRKQQEKGGDLSCLGNLKLLFLSYLRIKNFFYRTVVQQKTIHGLMYFQSAYYQTNSAFGRAALQITGVPFWERAIREQLQSQNLHKIEFRTSLSAQEKDNKINVFSFLVAYRNILRSDYCRKTRGREGELRYEPIGPLPRAALVCHLIKREQDYDPALCAYHGDEAHCRQYMQLHDQYQIQLQCLTDLRSRKNAQGMYLGLDKFIVGLDVASLESAVPTWVLTDLYEQARDSRSEPLTCHTGQSFQSLGFTIHAGEDFRHILSGLRRIYEAARGLKFHAGDRIGHGIALGLSPEAWHRAHPTIVIPRLEALENYLWVYSVLSSKTSADSAINTVYLEQEIMKLARDIYGERRNLTLSMLVRAYEKLYFPPETGGQWERLQACARCLEISTYTPSNPERKVPQDAREKQTSMPVNTGFFKESICKLHNSAQRELCAWSVTELVWSVHCRQYAYAMNEPIHRKVTEQDICIAGEMQRLVQCYLNEQGIIVEVNPSSNVVITDMETLSENQVYSINHAGYDFRNVLTCVNSDDPSVFNTNVTNELGYIYFGMIERGTHRESTLQWIEKLRDTGMRASFIRNTVSDECLLRELDNIIKQF